MTRDEAKAKIAKLMALANGGASENEAETALRQAAYMMQAHAIEAAELQGVSGVTQSYDWTTVLVPLHPQKFSPCAETWIGILAVAIGRFTDCKVEYAKTEQYGYCIAVKGDMLDVEYGVYLMKHLRDTVRGKSAHYGRGKGEKTAFRLGMVSRLGARMKAYRAESEAALRETIVPSGGTALSIVSNKLSLRDAQFGKSRTRKSSSRQRYNGRDAGASAADNVGFGKPVSQSHAALEHR